VVSQPTKPSQPSKPSQPKQSAQQASAAQLKNNTQASAAAAKQLAKKGGKLRTWAPNQASAGKVQDPKSERDTRGNINPKGSAQRIQGIQASYTKKISSNSHVQGLIRNSSNNFQRDYRNRMDDNDANFRRNRDGDLRIYGIWQNYGFCADGRCFDYQPDYTIDTDYSNPVIYRLFVGALDSDSCSAWYGADGCDEYPGLLSPFKYTGIFYPTQDFADLNILLSQLSVDAQASYETGLRRLGDYFTSITGNVPDQSSVVVDYYQVMPNSTAVVIEGFVFLSDGSERPFKAFLSLQDSSIDAFFIPSADDGSELPSDVQALSTLNNLIYSFGGVVEDSAP
jgi:hypothetical protein